MLSLLLQGKTKPIYHPAGSPVLSVCLFAKFGTLQPSAVCLFVCLSVREIWYTLCMCMKLIGCW